MEAEWTPRAHSSVPARIPARIPMYSICRCTARLLSCTTSGGMAATRWATASTASSSSASGKAALAQPSATASIPLMESPVIIISIARRMPRNQTWKCISGTPNRTAG